MAEAHPEAQARMVDVTSKDVTRREATAQGLVRMSGATRDLVVAGKLEKGDALEVARVAGIMGAKRTSELIPLCHPLAITSVDVDLGPVDEGIAITASVRIAERTGVEMEALTAAAVAALSIYDATKQFDRSAEITGLHLVSKAGGKSGDYRR